MSSTFPDGRDGIGAARVPGADSRLLTSLGACPPVGPPVDHDGRLALLTADVRLRLRAACRGWADDDFEAVVDQIARTKLRWNDALGGPRRA